VTAFVNALFDLITICTVNNRDMVGEQVNLVVHIIYLESILSFIYLLFLYMRSYLETSLRFSELVRRLHSLPFIISTIGIIVLPITYEQGKVTDYSLGPKAYALYGSLVVYLVMILYYCLRYWEIMDGEKRVAILMAVPIYIVTAAIQMMIPETLLEIAASTLILLGLMLSNENTEKYLDEKTALFNQYSFEKVLEEIDFDRQDVILAVLCLCKTGSSLDWSQDAMILHDIYREIKQFRLYGYRISESGVVLLGSSELKAQMILDRIKHNVETHYGKENINIETKILSGESTATKHSCIWNIIVFYTETGSRLAYIDYLTNIYNRNALERDLDERLAVGNAYYFIADLNGLKMVNDTLGHSAGDRLLQEFARVLVDAVGDDGRAYRQGGDEFVVLLYKSLASAGEQSDRELQEADAQQFIRRLDSRCREYNQFSSIPISYAIGYSPISRNYFRDEADQMMYVDKRRMKRQDS